MNSNEPALLAVIAKQLRELRDAFKSLSKQSGPAGKDGRDGVDGKDGVGIRGERGAAGPRGPAGPRGEPGRDGVDGKDGERGPAPDHQWKSTKLRFQKPDGTWGKYVDLKGERGASGAGGGGWSTSSGASGGEPGPAWSPDELAEATDTVPDEFIVQQNGQWVRATYAQVAAWLGAQSNLDGGGASSVYLPEQIVDGGGANG